MSWISLHKACPWCTSKDAYSTSIVTIKNKPTKVYKCFSCGKSKIETTKLTKLRDKSSESLPLPKYNSSYLPDSAVEWLAKYELTNRDTLVRGMMWNNYYQRLIIPINDAKGVLKGSQGRDIFGKSEVKWMTFGAPPPYYTPYNMVLKDRRERCPDIFIVVEDMISAIKLDVLCPALALLGTSISKEKEAFIAKLPFKKVIVWLDGDEAGKAGAAKTIRILEKYFIVSQIITAEDPKCLSYSQLQEFLSGYL